MSQAAHTASDPRSSVWVSANAGSGKTRVLTDRVLRLLLSGNTPSKILCLTYTNAAAAEMKHRIYQRLSDWVVADPKTLRDELTQLEGTPADEERMNYARTLFARVVDSSDGVRIETIHGFCQYVLRRFPLEAGIAPHFTVIDDRKADALLEQSVHILFNRQKGNSAELTSVLRAFTQTLTENSFEDLVKQIIKSRAKLQRLIEPPHSIQITLDNLQKRLESEYGCAMDATTQDMVECFFTYTDAQWRDLAIVAELLQTSDTPTDQKTGKKLLRWIQTTNEERANAVQIYQASFLNADGDLYSEKHLFTKKLSTKHAIVSDVILHEQARAEKYVAACKGQGVYRSTQQMLVLAEAILSVYGALKEQYALLDFEDLILAVKDLLKVKDSAQWVLFKLDGGLDHLLLDESQDTAPSQWEIIRYIVDGFFHGEGSRRIPRTVFVVGDEKQSIFGFNQADPERFQDMRRWFRAAHQASEMPYMEKPLHVSYRSTSPILQAVDLVFSDAEIARGVSSADQRVEHIAHREHAYGKVELWEPVIKQKADKPDAWDAAAGMLLPPRAETVLAKRIAATIRQWLDEGRILSSTGKPIQPADIMILVRKRDHLMDPLIRALRRQRVPVMGSDRLVLTEHLAVRDMMSLMRVLLLPQDDLELAIVLRSPLIGLSEDALFALAHGRGTASLWERLKDSADHRDAYAWVSQALSQADRVRPHELLSLVLFAWDGMKRCVARLGEEARDPLEELLTLALEYEHDHTPSLQGFLHYLESYPSVIKRDMEQSHNEVRVLTVHGAKGLEAPVVFLPVSDAANTSDRQPIAWMEDDRLCLWAPYSADRDRVMERVFEEKKRKQAEEERRLLYVALTRARDELIIAGVKEEKKKEPDITTHWLDMVKRGMEAQATQNTHHCALTAESWDVWRLENPSVRKPAEMVSAPSATPSAQQALPAWIHHPPPAEPKPARPLTPSQWTASGSPMLSPVSDQERILRGTLTHTLLQYLPNIPHEQRQEKIRAYLIRQKIAQALRDSIESELLALIAHPDAAPLFTPEGLSEVPISGVVMGQDGEPVVMNGQIDRMVVGTDTVWIVDYKTGREVPHTARDIPLSYRRQMRAYRDLVAALYPSHAIRCSLLWTAGPVWMPLDDELLQPEVAPRAA